MTADQDVDNDANGVDSNGTALPYAQVAMFYDGNMFGRSKDYAYPEASNTSSSRWDQITSMAKLLTRTQTLADNNDYDLWDCVFTIAKWVVQQNPHINDNEVLSTNYTPPSPS
jgi:hypothetical protein